VGNIGAYRLVGEPEEYELEAAGDELVRDVLAMSGERPSLMTDAGPLDYIRRHGPLWAGPDTGIETEYGGDWWMFVIIARVAWGEADELARKRARHGLVGEENAGDDDVAANLDRCLTWRPREIGGPSDRPRLAVRASADGFRVDVAGGSLAATIAAGIALRLDSFGPAGAPVRRCELCGTVFELAGLARSFGLG
jgi:hypothetical protein